MIAIIRTRSKDRDGNLYGMSAPSNFELMRKINELVEEVNRLKKKLEEE